MTPIDLDFIAVECAAGRPYKTLLGIGQEVFSGEYVGRVFAKGRPRMGAHAAYTPANTRKFESAVRLWARRLYREAAVSFPLRGDLIIFDTTPKDFSRVDHWLACEGLHVSGTGDLDNMAKGIFDALNTLVYADDRQLKDVRITRRYADDPGFHISLVRCGLSEAELHNFRRRLLADEYATWRKGLPA